MISIRTATNELDRMEGLLHAVSDAYGQGVRSTADYVVEINPANADEFRAHLQALQRQVVSADSPEAWRAIQASFRGELRDYRAKAAGELECLRAEIRTASEAVQQFAESVTASDSDHEAQIKETLVRLDVVSQFTDLNGVRAGIRNVADSISDSIAVMQRSHKAAVAQMRDEIRVLHKQVDMERRAHLVDHATGVWIREKLDSRIAELAAAERGFCLLLVYVRNLKQLHARYSGAIVKACLGLLVKRLSEMLGEKAMIGRWEENSFAAILEVPASAAMGLSRAATQSLSGIYAVQESGESRNVSLVAVAGVIDWAVGVDDDAYQKKLRQMSEALAGD
ncbi:MAG: GGDEF domain-containing protein [Bryobacterales bacterium]|nr:GGDEF domain-containing protein [Bryobacterales bacterium]